MLGKLCFEVGFIAIDILSLEIDRGCDVEVMEKAGDMQEDRVASLIDLVSTVLNILESGHTSEIPNIFSVTLPPCSVPSSISIDWNLNISFLGSNPTSGGLSHC